MSNAGYKEIKNVIHNDIGVTKEEILEVFRQIAKDEIQKIVTENKAFIYEAIREVIRQEMIKAVQSHHYPKIINNIWDYTNENSFKDFISGMMKEEIIKTLREQFELEFDIKRNKTTE